VEVPDFVEPITGWRVWRVARSADGFRLLSALYPELWLPGRALTGICLARGEGELDPETQRPSASPHAAPGERCTCGVYAADSVAAAAGYLCGRNDAAVVHRALGEVALWGRVAVAEHGWRASRAYPAEIFVPTPATAARPPPPTRSRAGWPSTASPSLPYRPAHARRSRS
jgi:hypothetical protein